MKESIKKRIESVRRGEVPEGYRRAKDIGIAPADWKVGQLSDVLHNEPRPVSKPNNPYWRLGIRSWAKGTFRAYVDDPTAVDMGELYVVRENDLVVNITFAWEHAIAVASKEDDGLLVSHRFPTYVFDRGNVPAYYKAVVSQQYFKDMLDHISPGGAGRNRVLNRKDFLALPCYVPPVAEQQKIAEILATCDRMIELKQSKIDELKKLKQVCLLEMFPQKGQTIPNRRFPGFSAPWEQRKVSDLAEKTYGGGTPTTSNEAYWNGDIPWIQSSDVVDGKLFGVEPRKRITQDGLNNSAAQLIPENSIAIITRVGVGKLAFMPFSYATSQDFLSLSRLNTEPLFTVYACYKKLQSELNAVQGTSIKGITKEELLAKAIMVPQYAEQQQIGTFFSQLDHLITLHQRELAEVGKYKKTLMQLLLTGLVRVNA